ncbi:hypothetical protein [Chroococcidiopsis sp. TS-821]|uniref:hypothetical protein n=1 Tax=Chroococcidiopsis sp. TS-821 TaxID=1378066 RepID=UPI000CEDAE4B|nr:hypothetical protein [Chroococcidiopsis sp. TS-821]PPS45056.1 hypothetical protein B1A85_01930 [Chroococcidiopsis sp. TS-821]
MIGFIKNIFSGILSFFIGLFGGKKSQKNQPSLEADKSTASPAKKQRKRNGYFMELDEAEETQPTKVKEQVTQALEPVAAKLNEVAQKAEPITAKVTEVAQKTAEPVAAKVKEVTQKTEEPVTAANSKEAEQPAIAAKSTKAEEPATATQAPKVQLEQTAEGVKPVPAKPSATSTINKPQTETTFAPKYLNPTTASSNGRRRPGPNMNSFLDMARQVKTPG